MKGELIRPYTFALLLLLHKHRKTCRNPGNGKCDYLDIWIFKYQSIA